MHVVECTSLFIVGVTWTIIKFDYLVKKGEDERMEDAKFC